MWVFKGNHGWYSAFLVALGLKNPPANAEDKIKHSFDPWVGKTP